MPYGEAINRLTGQSAALDPESYRRPGRSGETALGAMLGMSGAMTERSGQLGQRMESYRREQAAKAEAARKEKDYQRVRNPAGGYTFYDPNGQQISPMAWMAATGAENLEDVLGGSLDPGDIRFINEWTNLKKTQATGKETVILDPNDPEDQKIITDAMIGKNIGAYESEGRYYMDRDVSPNYFEEEKKRLYQNYPHIFK